jgi:hypothetical protein
VAKPKTCKCGKEFKQYNSLQKYCSYTCQNKYAKPKRISQISEKRKTEIQQYSILRKEFLSDPKNQICPITKQPTTDVHHKKGRVGSLFLDTRYWLAVSREGHVMIEENPEWAKEKGYSLNRLN